MRNGLLVLVLLAAAWMGGCGGHYTLTVGDHVGPAAQYAPVVVRLQRNDFFVLDLPVKDAAMRLRVGEELERGAYTDKIGYAATTVPTPAEPGRYPLHADHMDKEGVEVAAQASMYVWDPQRPVVAVDLNALPPNWVDEAHAARAGLKRIAQQANIIYLTRERIREQVDLHDALTAGEYPDGPILLWQREQWHIVRDDKYKFPRVIVEDRLVSQLPELRQMFPGLTMGIASSPMAAEGLYDAGLTPVVIGGAGGEQSHVIRFDSWVALAEQGLPLTGE